MSTSRREFIQQASLAFTLPEILRDRVKSNYFGSTCTGKLTVVKQSWVHPLNNISIMMRDTNLPHKVHDIQTYFAAIATHVEIKSSYGYDIEFPPITGALAVVLIIPAIRRDSGFLTIKLHSRLLTSRKSITVALQKDSTILRMAN